MQMLPVMATLHAVVCFICPGTCIFRLRLPTLCLHITKILFSSTLGGEQTTINTACWSRQHPISYHPFSDWDSRQKKKHGAGFSFKRKIHPNYRFSKTHLTHNGQDTHLAFNVKWSVNFSLSPLNCFLIILFKQLIARLSERVFSRERKCHSMKEQKNRSRH